MNKAQISYLSVNGLEPLALLQQANYYGAIGRWRWAPRSGAVKMTGGGRFTGESQYVGPSGVHSNCT